MISDAFAIVFPPRPILVNANERITIDATALGNPETLSYQILRLAPPPSTTESYLRIETTACRVRARKLPAEPTATFAVDLPDGSYAVEVLVTLDEGRRYTSQGFHLLVREPTAGSASPVAAANPERALPPPCNVVIRAPVYTEVSPGSRPRKGAPT